MNVLFFLIPAVVIFLLAIPFLLARKNIRNLKKLARINLAAFGAIFLVCLVVPCTAVFADSGENTPVPIETTQGEAVPAAADSGLATGLGYIGAALAVGLSGIGAGIAVAAAAPAAIGAVSENEKSFGKAMIFVVLGEGIAIYGLVIAFMIVLNL